MSQSILCVQRPFAPPLTLAHFMADATKNSAAAMRLVELKSLGLGRFGQFDFAGLVAVKRLMAYVPTRKSLVNAWEPSQKKPASTKKRPTPLIDESMFPLLFIANPRPPPA